MMETCTPRVSLTHQGEWGEVVTPLRVGAWDRGLLVEYIVRGIREGFRIGFNRRECECKSAKGNMGTAEEHGEITLSYLSIDEVADRIHKVGRGR